MKVNTIYYQKYRVIEILKQTENVCVALAEHISLGNQWIIKRLYNARMENVNEVTLLKSIHHAGIPLIVDVFEEAESITIVKQYVAGRTLAERIEQEGLLSEQHCLDIGIKICDILIYLHEGLRSPLIYRDITPANIVIDAQQNIYLIDFGIARYYDAAKVGDTEYLGTSGFASPEQFGLCQSSVKTDVFGLGATMHYLLTMDDLGKPPYRFADIGQIRTDISDKLIRIIRKACELDAKQRYQSIRLLRTELENLIPHNKTTLDQVLSQLQAPKIVICGLKHGVGTTHITLCLAQLLALVGQVLVIDTSPEQALEQLEYEQDCKTDQGFLRYREMTIGSLAVVCKADRISLRAYDYILIDGGLYQDFMLNHWTVEAELAMGLVSGLNPWERDLLEDEMLHAKNQKSYLINHCSSQVVAEFKASSSHRRVYPVPTSNFYSDWLQRSDLVTRYQEILSGWEVKPRWQSEESLISKIIKYSKK